MKASINQLIKYSKYLMCFLKWTIISVLSGIIVSIVGVAFHYGIELVTELRHQYDFLIFLLPLGAILIVLFNKLLKMTKNIGTDIVFLAIREDEKIPIKTAISIFVSTIITHLVGGSAGREGAALQIGGSISSQLARFIKLDEKDTKIIIMCGMSACFSSLFGTPITAAIFAIEITSVGIMHYTAIVPSVISSIVGFYISLKFGVVPTRFYISYIPHITVLNLLKVVLIGLVFAIFSIIFCFVIKKSGEIFKTRFKNEYIRILVGAIILITLTLIFGTNYNGAGMEVINHAFVGNSAPQAFLLKLIFTAITLGCGFKGGEIVPVLFIGSTFGNLLSRILNINSSFGAGLGMVALFCGVTNAPISSMILSIELFGGEGIIFFALACSISYMVSGYQGLYSEQKIIYSKTKFEKKYQIKEII